MKSLKYNKAKIMERLEENKKNHRAKVEKAWEVYQQRVTEELAARLDDAKNNKPVDPGFLHFLPVPQDFTEEYDRVIDQLETTVDEIVELSDQEFRQYLRDEWGWQHQFEASTSAYLAG